MVPELAPRLIDNPPPHFPERNSYFCGRKSDLKKIHQQLLSSDTAINQPAIRGFGGVGKSALAIEYAHEHADEFPGGVFYLSCESLNEPAALVSTIAELINDISTDRVDDVEICYRLVMHHLQRKPTSLLVLDGVSETQWENHSWFKVLPNAQHCRRLVTTRAEELTGLDMHPLGRLEKSDAIKLLRKFRAISKNETESVRKIIEWVEGLAVALTCIGVYMSQSTSGWSDYAKILEKRGLGTLRATEKASGNVPDRYNKRIESIIADLLSSCDEATRRTLDYSALMPPDSINRKWLVDCLNSDSDIEFADRPGESPGSFTIKRLIDNQLFRPLSKNSDWFSLHQIVAERIREDLSTDQIKKKRLQDNLLTMAVERAKVCDKEGMMDNSLRQEVTPLLAIAKIMREERPTINMGELAGRLGPTLRFLGRFEEAKFVTTIAIEIEEAVYEPNHPTLATSYSNLALLEQDLGNLERAKELLNKAIEIEEAAYEPNHPTLATSYSNLALVEKNLGNLERAKELLNKAIEIEEAAYEPNHPMLATRYSNLALVEQDLGNLERAKELLNKAIEIDEAVYEPNHPTLATNYSNLAMVEQDLGNLERAKELLNKAIEIDEAAYEPNHPTLATRYSNLAMVEQDLGNLERAKELLNKAIEIDEAAYEPNHPTLATSYSNLALVEQDLGNLERAKELLNKAIEIDEAAYEPNHPTLATSYSNLAMVEQDLENLERAKELLNKAIEIGEAVYEPNHPTLATRYSNLAMVEKNLGNLSIACCLWRRADSIFFERFGPQHPHTRTVQNFLETWCKSNSAE